MEHLNDEDVLLTFREAEEYLRVSRATVYRLVWSGQLTGHKVGKSWRFFKTDVRKLVEGKTPFFPQGVAHGAGR